MSLSNSRQQFLAYETQPNDVVYSRRGGVFISTFVCVFYFILTVVVAGLVGVIVYFITYHKLSEKAPDHDFWDESNLFNQDGPPNPDLRLPPDVVPSFYRLKLKNNLDNESFTGEVYITIRASRSVKEIILHSKNLTINDNANLTEQIYEKLDTIQSSSRVTRNVHSENTRDASNNTNNKTVSTTSSQLLATEIISSTDKVFSVTPSNDSDSNKPQINDTKNIQNETNGNVHEEFTSDSVASSTINHSVDLSLSHIVTHSSVRKIKITSIKLSSGDRLILSLASPLNPEVDYTLELSFGGKISNSMTGFYMSTYSSNNQEKRLAVTQFEPISARSAFPCFDEPAFKAKFEISISHPKNLSVLSNMKVATQELIAEQADWMWTHFERSVRMSTYLVAYILSDFASVETSYKSKDNLTKPIRIWCRPELINQTKYALNITPKILEYYEDVFGLPYALDKLDMVAIPDFSSGAMENWGLITYRETALLFDESSASPRDKQNIAIDIAHELAHQWFGNLVTMKWWTDLWLNEGFASYMEYVGVNHIEPEWNILRKFIQDKMEVLRADAYISTTPLSRSVVDASQISQKFDEISYSKGASLIGMLNHTISEELYRKGLDIYLNEWKYSNAEENDLWEAMTKATKTDASLRDLSVVEFMNSWTKQAGYPMVYANRNYTNGIVTFEQKLFTTSKNPEEKITQQIWQIPISYTPLNEPLTKWSTKPKLWLKERSVDYNITLDNNVALYVNINATGYYRVNYDTKNWQLLSAALKSGLMPPIMRAQLIDDSFNLAKISQMNYSNALELTTYLMNGEDSRMVWELLLNNLAFLKYTLRETSGYIYFQDYVKILLKAQLERLNYGLNKPKDDNEAFLIENLLAMECFVESHRCVQWAKNEFDKWMNEPDSNNNPIPSHLRSIVYNSVLKHGGRREFDFLWNVFQNSTDPSVKSLVINSLPATREECLITMLLEKSISEIPKQYAIGVWNVEPPVGTRIAQDFLIDNFDLVYDRFTEMDSFMYPTALQGAFSGVHTAHELNKLKSFVREHKDKLVPMSQMVQKMIDGTNLKINWLKEHSVNINKWFKEFVTAHRMKNEYKPSDVFQSNLPPRNVSHNNTSELVATSGDTTLSESFPSPVTVPNPPSIAAPVQQSSSPTDSLGKVSAVVQNISSTMGQNFST